MTEEPTWTVGQLAELAGVTVRTLHHFDEIGLLQPSGRSAAGYRQYGAEDLARLRQVLTWRELGFPLEQVAQLVVDDGAVTDELLARQQTLLEQRVEQLRSLAEAVRHERKVRKMGMRLTPEEQLAVFGDQPVTEWAQEAERRWGDSDTYRQSRRRTSAYTREDWERITASAADLERRLAQAMAGGEAPTGGPAMDLAEEHRLAIHHTYYDCGYEMHRALGDMYVADERFTARYEAVAPGLAAYLRDAIHANADRASLSGGGG